jgi:hypothetical protein
MVWGASGRPGMAPEGYGRMRASHADRERAIDVLKAAFAEGRLDKDEYIERVGQVQASRSYADLAALTADVPAGPLGALAGGTPRGTLAGGTRSLAVPAAVPTAAWGTSILAVAVLIFGLAADSVPLLLLAAFLLVKVALARTGRTFRRGR